MATFIAQSHTASEYNNGVRYIDEDLSQGIEGDSVQADTINCLVESSLYAQEQAENAKRIATEAADIANGAKNTAESLNEQIKTANATAHTALEKVDEAIKSSFDKNGNYPNVSVGKATDATNSTNDGNGDNIANTYATKTELSKTNTNLSALDAVAVKKADIAKSIADILYPPNPTGSQRMYLQFPGDPKPNEIFPGTVWIEDVSLAGKVVIGSRTDTDFGTTGGNNTQTLTTREMPRHSHYPEYGGQVLAMNVLSGSETTSGFVAAQEGDGLWRGFPKRMCNLDYQGEGKEFSIMQSYSVGRYWRRTS